MSPPFFSDPSRRSARTIFVWTSFTAFVTGIAGYVLTRSTVMAASLAVMLAALSLGGMLLQRTIEEDETEERSSDGRSVEDQVRDELLKLAAPLIFVLFLAVSFTSGIDVALRAIGPFAAGLLLIFFWRRINTFRK